MSRKLQIGVGEKSLESDYDVKSDGFTGSMEDK